MLDHDRDLEDDDLAGEGSLPGRLARSETSVTIVIVLAFAMLVAAIYLASTWLPR